MTKHEAARAIIANQGRCLTNNDVDCSDCPGSFGFRTCKPMSLKLWGKDKSRWMQSWLDNHPEVPPTPTRGTPGVQPLLAEYMASHTLYDATLNYEGYSFTYVVEGTQGDFIILNLEPVLRLTKPLHKSPPVTYFKDKLDILTDLGLFARGDYTDLAYTLIEQDYFSSDPPESDD